MSPGTSTARQRLREESGIAIPLALAVLLTTFVLAGVATAVAMHTNSASNRDTNAKTAIEAADTGLRTAVYRLNVYKPPGDSCPTVPAFTAVGSGAPTSTLCAQDGPEALGNGASFSYWISRAMQPGDTCAGPAVSNSTNSVAQRCVTAVGTANGVKARVQERVAAYTSTPVFPTAIFGTTNVTINNNVNIISDTPANPALIGTNGSLNIGGSGGGTTLIDGWAVPSNVTRTIGSNVTDAGPESNNVPPYPIPTSINPGTSTQNTASPYVTPSTFQSGTCAQPLSFVGTWVQTNCDYRIVRGVTSPGCLSLGLPVTECDPYLGNSNNVVFDPVGRTLWLGNNVTLVLGGGVYNFCSLYMNNGSQILLAGGNKTSIFIDSPYDQNSGTAGSATNPPCSASNSAKGVAPGTFTAQNGAAINPGGTALNAQIYVYGDTSTKPTTNAVNLLATSSSSFELDAPFSNVILNPSNNTTFKGAIVGYTVTIGNAAHFTYEADSSNLQVGSLQLYYRMFWTQCPAVSSSSTDPTAGC